MSKLTIEEIEDIDRAIVLVQRELGHHAAPPLRAQAVLARLKSERDKRLKGIDAMSYADYILRRFGNGADNTAA